jgi:hypothetical protein
VNQSLRGLILDLAVEDAVGLWEIGWRAKRVQPPPTLFELIDVTLGMIHEGLLEVVSSSSEREPIAAVQAEAEVKNELNWTEPRSAERHVRVVATAKGESAYFER